MPTCNVTVTNRDGVYRYNNRNPPDDMNTRDHRLELIKKGDMRDALRSAVSELPDAPCYMLLQGSAIGLGCWFTTDLTGEERYRIRETAGHGAKDVPFVIVSMGYV